MPKDISESALRYHAANPPGKLEIRATKPLANQRDLALAYSPGVAAASMAIAEDPEKAWDYTIRGNLVAVITNGTAVLGLGDIGPLAAKPVMEGKAVLFKKFAGIDVFDIEVAEKDPDKFIEAVARLEPTFGGINLEDIKSPECFEIEKRLAERLNIPVLHDDQHGTAIVVAAGLLNALAIIGKDLSQVKFVCSGAGAAALACLDLLCEFGLRKENLTICDIKGVVYEGRTELMDPYKARYARATHHRTLAEAIVGADVFLGLSAPRVLTGELVKTMAGQPIIFALANPTPEIMPDEVHAVRSDALMATGRSDFPNQVNNVLCFPFLFRGALDCGATTINVAMKMACARAIADLARQEASEIVLHAYQTDRLVFGADYIIPKPFDPRLITELPAAVAKAAMDSGVASRPIADFRAYKDSLSRFVFRSGLLMRPVMEGARKSPRRVIFAEGERVRVLQATQQIVAEGIARPILVGRRDVIHRRLHHLGLRVREGEDYEVFDAGSDSRVAAMAGEYHALVERKGVTPARAQTVVRSRNTVVASLLLRRGDGDGMICGTEGQFDQHLRHVREIIGKRSDVCDFAAMSGIILPSGTTFIADTDITFDPTAEHLVDMTVLAVEKLRRIGLPAKVALISHSNFGSADTPTAIKMRRVLELLRARVPDLEVEGEMQADTALSVEIREEIFPNSRLQGAANLLIMPTLDAANVAFNVVKVLGEGIPLGPILLGAAAPVHIVEPSTTVRGLLNMTALTVADANEAAGAAGDGATVGVSAAAE